MQNLCDGLTVDSHCGIRSGVESVRCGTFYRCFRELRIRAGAMRHAVHSLHETSMIALLSTFCGDEGCVDMEQFGRAEEPFPRRFMTMKHGIPSDDAVSDLFNALDPGQPASGVAAASRRLGGGARRWRHRH